MPTNPVTRTSITGEPRAPLCGMGICFECAGTCATLAGLAAAPPPPSNVRAHVLVVGAGPAGLAASAAVAWHGADVVLLDDNPAAGGQIWRAMSPAVAPRVRTLYSTRIVDAPAPNRLRAISGGAPLDLEYEKLILATGARERFLPFPGWTLPHVTGAGGLQALAKSGLADIAGARIVLAGTGPLLLAVARYLVQHGARVLAIAEQAPAATLARFTAALPAAKLREGLALTPILRRVPLWTSTWPIAAAPGSATLLRRGRPVTLACDFLACGFHLVPNLELPLLLGCATQNGFVIVNDRQETTVPDVFCAGEPTGIGGLELAQAEGEIAGLAAIEAAAPGALLTRRAGYRRFAAALAEATALRPELRTLAQPDTFVCRCEDVTFSRMAAHSSWREAKLHTRCGMGPCQGRVCGPAAEFLFAWPDTPSALAPRPPIFPAPVAALTR